MLILAETGLHLLISISYVNKIKSTDYFIVWMGRKDSFAYSYFCKKQKV